MCKNKRNFDYAHFFCAGKKEKMNQLSKRFCGIIAEKIKRKEKKEQKDTDIEKYLLWSEELPDEIRNYEEEYTELNLI